MLCRGESAGFAHLSCIVEYAKQKTREWGDGEDVDFEERWHCCPNCKQGYQNELYLELATEFVTFAQEEYPDEQETQLTSLSFKLDALHSVSDRLQLKQVKKAAKHVANKLLSIIRRIKREDFSRLQEMQEMEAEVYNCLGGIAFEEGTKEGAKEAMEYYEKSRDMSRAAGWTEGLLTAESNLLNTKFEYKENNEEEDWGTLEEEKLKLSRKRFEHCVKEHGEEDMVTTEAGVNLAIDLYNSDHTIEAERLLTNLVATSKRVHGPHHHTTKWAESELLDCKTRYVIIKSQNENEIKQLFQALRYEEDGGKCVIQGPITKPGNIQAEQTLSVASKDVIYLEGNPVVCHGLADCLSNLNGKIGEVGCWEEETGSYEVHFEDEDLEPCLVKHEHVRILFELPD